MGLNLSSFSPQNLSSAINAIENVGSAESGSAAVTRGLQAYDAVQSFADKPVTAGVNLIYEEEEETNTHTANSFWYSTNQYK